ncbi:hypothetical protein RFI_07690 [Reticulomyxa filosa]|uniref:Uncharacterized protein n=1 Tax=Reticulomyxa filosa TaxID=46433 RepID=X6NT33_RETFI|nr:hypothetical protein RFI_07690 [Reticulomyxa filosa]|eukprot:ETO29430.1 hypothetical protein RFI_07690 [Reticulomyxa filosa]
MKIRMQLIHQLNVLLIDSIPWIDVSLQSCHAKSEDVCGRNLCLLLCKFRYLLFHCITKNVWDNILQMTKEASGMEPTFQIDRYRCMDDNEPNYTMFGEAVKQLDSYKCEIFRLDVHQKAWKVVLYNEHSVDAGMRIYF